MASYVIPPFYAAFIWWFSTGAVLLLVGRRGPSEWPRIVSAAGLFAAALFGLALTANDTGVAACYTAFTCTILLWGSQEIAFLAGWLTGPRAQPCPVGAKGRRRLGFALQAILYHELMLLVCGAAVVALTWNGVNPIGLWTFATLWVLRQSSKINLFLGVPVTNDELMPEAVRFLKTYFVRKSVGSFYPVSVTAATAVLVIMIQRIVEVAATPFEVVSLTLVSTLFALGVLEHWFMLLPLPAITLWGWGMRSPLSPEEETMKQGPDTKGPDANIVLPNVVVLSSARGDAAPAKSPGAGARQRLEDLFRQRFLEQNAGKDLATALSIAEPAATVNGRGTS
jgi:putative photosynthetic complex assembly protein 2